MTRNGILAFFFLALVLNAITAWVRVARVSPRHSRLWPAVRATCETLVGPLVVAIAFALPASFEAFVEALRPLRGVLSVGLPLLMALLVIRLLAEIHQTREVERLRTARANYFARLRRWAAYASRTRPVRPLYRSAAYASRTLPLRFFRRMAQRPAAYDEPLPETAQPTPEKERWTL